MKNVVLDQRSPGVATGLLSGDGDGDSWPGAWKGHRPHAGAELEAWKAAGQRIRALRVALGLTMEQLCERAGINRTMLCKYERGERPVTMNSALCVGPALGSTAKYILFGGE